MSETALQPQPLNSPRPCLRCGYDLRGSVGPEVTRCPECGWTLPLGQTLATVSRTIDNATETALSAGVAALLFAAAPFTIAVLASGVTLEAADWAKVGVLILAGVTIAITEFLVKCGRLTVCRDLLRRNHLPAIILTALVGAFSWFACVLGAMMALGGGASLLLLGGPAGAAQRPWFGVFVFMLLSGPVVAYFSPRIGYRAARAIMHAAIVGHSAARVDASRAPGLSTDRRANKLKQRGKHQRSVE